tara:strand:+ start:497 stop:760 length:264 start_codon:yes stop_codon:yes gene_type:complete
MLFTYLTIGSIVAVVADVTSRRQMLAVKPLGVKDLIPDPNVIQRFLIGLIVTVFWPLGVVVAAVVSYWAYRLRLVILKANKNKELSS